MQEFKTKFTTDISQHQRVMGEFRNSVRTSMESVKKMTSLVGLTGLAGSGLGIGILSRNIVKLGADMQDTRTAFETMLGSAEKGNKVLALLNKFSDITPFDNKEVIQAGRSLLNVGVATTDLTGKLTMLGDIAAGSQQPLNDIVAIYAKAANKGKVAAQELNQLSERGIPIMAALAKITGKNTAEVMKLGEQGKLSFGLMEEAMHAMTSKGGQYFGLMAKQSQNLNGLWAGVEVEIEKIGIAIGERAIPALTEGVQSLLDKIEKMKETGQLDAIISKLADTIGKTVLALRDLAVWLAANKENFIAIGKIGFYWIVWQKLNVAMTATVGIMRTIKAVDLAGSFHALRRSSPAIKILTADIKTLAQATGLLRTSLTSVGAIAATAFAGWELGKLIADVTGLGKAIENMYLRKELARQGKSKKEIDEIIANDGVEPEKKVKPSVTPRDLVADRQQQKNLKGEAEKLRSQITDLENAAPEKKRDNQIAALEQEAKDLEVTEKKRKELRDKIADLRNQAAAADRTGERAPALDARKKADELTKRAATENLPDPERGKLLSEAESLKRFAQGIESKGGSDKGDALRKEIAAAEQEAALLLQVQSAQKRRREIQDEITKLKQAPLSDPSDPSDKSDQSAAETLKKQLAAKEKEIADLAAAAQKYEEDAQKEIAELEKVDKANRAAQAKRKALEKELNDLKVNESKNIGTRKRPVQGYAAIGQAMSAANRGETSQAGKHNEKTPSHQETLRDELEVAKKNEAELTARFEAIKATKTAFNAAKQKLNTAELAGDAEAAVKQSEAAKLKAAEEAENNTKRLEAERKVAAERKKLKKEQQQLADAQFRDRMGDLIDKWRENIKGYQKQIDETEKKLSRLGLSVDDDILKTPEQILQARKDEILQAKINAHNKGGKVKFSDEEKARIAELQEAQQKAREAKKSKETDETSIEGTEKKVSDFDKKRRDQERKERAPELKQRDKALTAAEAQLNAAREANAPIVTILEKVADILKKGLPTETT